VGSKILDAVFKLIWCAIPSTGTFFWMRLLGESIGIQWLAAYIVFSLLFIVDNQNAIITKLNDMKKKNPGNGETFGV